jgi:thiamine pyrophosphokinase
MGVDELDWVSARARSHVIHRRRLLHGDIGATLSLIAVGGDAGGVHTSGLRWDLDNETLSHGGTRGISNVMRSPVAEVQLESGCLLAVFPDF